jgi:hypothetical protein
VRDVLKSANCRRRSRVWPEEFVNRFADDPPAGRTPLSSRWRPPSALGTTRTCWCA